MNPPITIGHILDILAKPTRTGVVTTSLSTRDLWIHFVIHWSHLMTEHRLGHARVPRPPHRRRRTQAEKDVEGHGARAVRGLQHVRYAVNRQVGPETQLEA